MMGPHVPELVTLSTEELWLMAGACLLMLIDVATGLLQAWMTHDYQSSKMREGLGHKIVLVLYIVLAVVIQAIVQHVGDVGWTVPMVYAVSLYILVMEVSSIVENLANAYPELKQTKLLSFFANSQKGEDSDA